MLLAGRIRTIEQTHDPKWLRLTLAHDDGRPWSSVVVHIGEAPAWHVGQALALHGGAVTEAPALTPGRPTKNGGPA
jgi:hypothetical protein